MPKEPLTKKEQILEAVEELRTAMIANLEAEEKLIEINREKTATHKRLVMAQQAIATIDYNI